MQKIKYSIGMLAILALTAVSCASDDAKPEPQLPKEVMLAGTTSKAWKLTDRSVDVGTCPELTPRELDNTYYFYADGVFGYNHGTITEDDCHGDLVNLIGTWQISAQADSILIQATGRISESGDTTTLTTTNILHGKMEFLEAQKLKISRTDPSGHLRYLTFEPR